MSDVTVSNYGSVVMLTPNTEAGMDWVDENIGDGEDSFQPYYPTIVCEPRYVEDIISGMQDDGLTVEVD